MKIAYFDCPTGLSGNMILGALIDAGLEASCLKQELCKLRINFKLQTTKTKRGNIEGAYVKVVTQKKEQRRSLADIVRIIKKSKLSAQIKRLSINIFQLLASAEAKVHGIPINRVHFHEVGAIDAIVDIAGSAIGIEKLGIQKIYCSPLPLGKGRIKHAHGILPNPAPATTELLKGIPTYGTNIKGELVTPTGAAIIAGLADSFGPLPKMKVASIGCGAGKMDLPMPNLLRIFIGEAEIPTVRDAILQIETNIDDLDPKLYRKIIARIMRCGALDAYLTPILMKNNRSAINLVVLTPPELKDLIIKTIFRMTTTLGVRTFLTTREKLQRKFRIVKTKYGKIKVKLGSLGEEITTIAPEFKDYRRIANKHHIPVEIPCREAKRIFLRGKISA